MVHLIWLCTLNAASYTSVIICRVQRKFGSKNQVFTAEPGNHATPFSEQVSISCVQAATVNYICLTQLEILVTCLTCVCLPLTDS